MQHKTTTCFQKGETKEQSHIKWRKVPASITPIYQLLDVQVVYNNTCVWISSV